MKNLKAFHLQLKLSIGFLCIRLDALVLFWMTIQFIHFLKVMSKGHSRENSNNKKMQEIVHRFQYYRSTVLQKEEFEGTNRTLEHLNQRQAEVGNSQYRYLKETRDSCNHQSYITKSMLTRIAREALVPKNANLHENQNSNMREPVQRGTEPFDSPSHVVDVVVMEIKNHRTKISNSHVRLKQTLSSSISSFSQQGMPKNYSIYVIHFPQENQSPWSYYVQRILLKEDRLSEQDQSHPLEYEAMLTFPKDSWFQRNVMKYFQTSTKMKYLSQLAKEVNHRLNLFESMLAKTLAQIVNQEKEEQKQCHPQFKRETRLPAEEYRKFEKVKSQIYQYYRQIHRDKKMNHYFVDNLICRFMMFKKYDEKDSVSSIKKYLDWQKDLRNKYTFQSFNHYHPLKIFEYIGKDYEGRPIIFFRAAKYVPSQIPNLKEYLDYNSFMIELYLQDHMEGYIDEYILIADYNGFGTDNFKYNIAKEFSETSNEYFPERQHKLVLFGVGSFGEWIFKMLKPVLPEFIIGKIEIFGAEKQKLKEYLMKLLDISQMPKDVFEDVTAEENSSGKKKMYTPEY